MLNAKIKDLKQQGKQNVEHKPDISTQDLQKLKYHPVLSPSTSLGLLRNVWFHTTLYWCRRGRECQRNLTSSSFKFLKDQNNRLYAKMTHDESTKNHPGGVGDVESFEKEGRLYETTDDPSDGFNALQFYISKPNPKCTAFFQYPKRKCSPSESIWYENRPLGIQKLGTMMKEMSEAAGLSKKYTNHSVRATAITLWSNAGLSNRHIMAISGHRNEQSLRSYNARPSSAQLQHSSDVLSNALSESGLPLFWLQLTRRPSHFLLFCGLWGQISLYFCHKTVTFGVVPCMSNSLFISVNPLTYHWLVDQVYDVYIAGCRECTFWW